MISTEKVRTLSILQPWAWLIVRPDIEGVAARHAAYAAGLIKNIENRTWPTKYRGRFLVHAGTKYTRRQHTADREYFLLRYGIALPTYEELPRGGVIGMVDLVDCVLEHDSKWKFQGSHGFVLDSAMPLPFMPYKGQLGWFSVEYISEKAGKAV